MANIQLTQELVKYLFDYKDGRLYWKVQKGPSALVGYMVGALAKPKNGLPRYITKINGKMYICSRIIFLWHHGYLPAVVDHKDRNTLNDKIENLRAATHSQNSKNRNVAPNKTSKYMGVCLQTQKGKWNYWTASIKGNGKYMRLGTFETQEQAALAYNKAAVKYHGEFANLNIIKL